MRQIRKKVILILLVVLLIGAGVLGFFYFKSLDPYDKLKMSKDPPISVIIPVENKYYTVNIKGSQQLEYSNDFNVWKYDTTIINITSKNPFLTFNQDGIYYSSTMVAKKIGNFWITIQDSDGYLMDSFLSLQEITGNISNPLLGDDSVMKNLPNVERDPNLKKVLNHILVPQDWDNISENSITFQEQDQYFVGTVSYSEYQDAIDMALARLQTLYGGVDKVYNDGKIMYAYTDEYTVGVEYINYNTQSIMYGKGESARSIVLENLCYE